MYNLTIENVAQLIRDIKPDIEDDYIQEEDSLPSICLTIATDRENLISNKIVADWNYQTGDNSYTGGCYGYDTWAVGYIYRRSNSREIAKELINELFELAYQ